MNSEKQCQSVVCLQKDHAIIGKFLRYFRATCQRIELGQPVSVPLTEIVTFIEDFVEEFHHKREEDVLFAQLKKMNPGHEHLGRRLTHDHEDGRHHVESMREHFALNDRQAKESFLWNALGYLDLSSEHLCYEERELYPYIQSLLDSKNDEIILADFDVRFPDSAQRLEQAEKFVDRMAEMSAGA